MAEDKEQPPKYTLKELTRRAFIWAEQDRQSLAHCWPRGSTEGAQAQSEADQLRAYRLKRWGRTRMEQIIEGATSIAVKDIPIDSAHAKD